MTTTTPPLATDDLTITGTVLRIYCSSEGFSAGRMRLPDSDIISYKAKFATRESERYTLRGAWVEDPRYGMQFSATSMVYETAVTREGLAHYLTTNKAFWGIGPARAKIIVDQFGDCFEETLENDPGAILRAAKLTPKMLDTLRTEWATNKERNALFTWLSQFELTQCQMNRLIETYGPATQSVLENDPYTLCREVRGYGFARTDQIALRMGFPKDHTARVRACINDLIYSISDDGHCYILSTDLLKQAEKALTIDTVADRVQIRETIGAMCDEGALISENLDDGPSYLAHPAIYFAEKYLANKFIDAASCPPDPLTDERITAMLDLLPDLNEVQEQALRMALKSRISLITGEAGTGKSYTIDAIRQAFTILEKSVAMAAPTGKAAKRMEEVCRHEVSAQTIHRLLGYNPHGGGERWTYNAENPLECDVLILDECGMVDVLLALRVFDAIDLERTQVILVGDHQQLPPVGAGNMLRDLLAYKYIPTLTLSQVVRQAGVLKENCVGILRGSLADTTPGEPGTLRPWYVLKHCDEPEDILASVLAVVGTELDKVGMGGIGNWQVLSPQHQGAVGVRSLNIHLQRLVQRKFHGREFDEPELPADASKVRQVFCVGDKVMQTRNNYKLNVMNGAQGIILAKGEPVEDENGKVTTVMRVDFGDPGRPEIVGIPEEGEEMQDLQLAYACTVHKYQGSEVPVSIVICSKAHSFMLSQNLLYTAVTRARKSCVLIGDWRAMRRALTNNATQQRRTWLAAWGAAAQQGGA